MSRTETSSEADAKLAELVTLHQDRDDIEADRLRIIYDLRVLGVPMERVAEADGVTVSAVYQALKRHEHAARARGEPPRSGWLSAEVPAADELHRSIAARYLELVAAGSRRPTAELAAERGVKRNTMAAHVARARQMGLLPAGSVGRAG